MLRRSSRTELAQNRIHFLALLPQTYFITCYARSVYRVSQEERSLFWEVIVLVILSKNMRMYISPIPTGFRDSTLYRSATRHVLTLAAKCIDVGGGIFEKYIILGKLYHLYHLNNKYWY
jgi:hypothetical protein